MRRVKLSSKDLRKTPALWNALSEVVYFLFRPWHAVLQLWLENGHLSAANSRAQHAGMKSVGASPGNLGVLSVA